MSRYPKFKDFDIISELEDFGIDVTVFDPLADDESISDKFDCEVIKELDGRLYDGVVIAVSHAEFADLGEQESQVSCVTPGTSLM